jgi:hypothetical protein
VLDLKAKNLVKSFLIFAELLYAELYQALDGYFWHNM